MIRNKKANVLTRALFKEHVTPQSVYMSQHICILNLYNENKCINRQRSISVCLRKTQNIQILNKMKANPPLSPRICVHKKSQNVQ